MSTASSTRMKNQKLVRIVQFFIFSGEHTHIFSKTFSLAASLLLFVYIFIVDVHRDAVDVPYRFYTRLVERVYIHNKMSG